MTVVEAPLALTVPLRVAPVPLTLVAALVVAVGAAVGVVKLSTDHRWCRRCCRPRSGRSIRCPAPGRSSAALSVVVEVPVAVAGWPHGGGARAVGGARGAVTEAHRRRGVPALTVPLRVEVVAVVPLAALVVAVGATEVVKLSTAP